MVEMNYDFIYCFIFALHQSFHSYYEEIKMNIYELSLIYSELLKIYFYFLQFHLQSQVFSKLLMKDIMYIYINSLLNSSK